jgi:hypothetical protein
MLLQWQDSYYRPKALKISNIVCEEIGYAMSQHGRYDIGVVNLLAATGYLVE